MFVNSVNYLQVPKHERGELERLEKLMNKYERGQIQHVEWLDRLAFKAIEKIKDRENSRNGSSNIYLVVEFCGFEHRVVFQVTKSGINIMYACNCMYGSLERYVIDWRISNSFGISF